MDTICPIERIKHTGTRLHNREKRIAEFTEENDIACVKQKIMTFFSSIHR
jgi:hypothetical protein